ncbi:hypothetical protein [Ekhidna sp.]|uniref:hypothetical protein n=1 Tax=Ekhidna sp. TaxID=2608089 RepID=UPI003B513CB9
MNSENKFYQRFVIKSASILFFLGLLTGIYVTIVATGKMEGNLSASLAAHLNGIIGSLIILSLILIIPYTKYGHTYKVIMIAMFIVSNYANWIITLIKSYLQVVGLEIIENSISNNLIHILLVVMVVIPSLTGAIMWILGVTSLKTSSKMNIKRMLFID